MVGRTANTKGQLLPHCWRFAEIDRGRLHPHALRGSNFRFKVCGCDFDAGADCRASEKRAANPRKRHVAEVAHHLLVLLAQVVGVASHVCMPGLRGSESWDFILYVRRGKAAAPPYCFYCICAIKIPTIQPTPTGAVYARSSSQLEQLELAGWESFQRVSTRAMRLGRASASELHNTPHTPPSVACAPRKRAQGAAEGPWDSQSLFGWMLGCRPRALSFFCGLLGGQAKGASFYQWGTVGSRIKLCSLVDPFPRAPTFSPILFSSQGIIRRCEGGVAQGERAEGCDQDR